VIVGIGGVLLAFASRGALTAAERRKHDLEIEISRLRQSVNPSAAYLARELVKGLAGRSTTSFTEAEMAALRAVASGAGTRFAPKTPATDEKKTPAPGVASTVS
jgi:hypothetical protein